MSQPFPPSLRSRACGRRGAFTLIELLTVMAIIAILAALILTISGYANQKAATSRAQSEIQAISLACESYKTDNGIYPRQALSGVGGTPPSDLLDPRTMGNPTASTYKNTSLELYQALTSDTNNNNFANTQGVPPDGTKIYLPNIKSDMLSRSDPSSRVSTANPVLYLSDPFGNSYGYSTMYQADLDKDSTKTPTHGFNPTFDLWSTGGQTTTPNWAATGGTAVDVSKKWITNWQ